MNQLAVIGGVGAAMSSSNHSSTDEVTTLPPIGLQEAIIKIEQQGYKVKHPESLGFRPNGFTYFVTMPKETVGIRLVCTFETENNNILKCDTHNDWIPASIASVGLICLALVFMRSVGVFKK